MVNRVPVFEWRVILGCDINCETPCIVYTIPIRTCSRSSNSYRTAVGCPGQLTPPESRLQNYTVHRHKTPPAPSWHKNYRQQQKPSTARDVTDGETGGGGERARRAGFCAGEERGRRWADAGVVSLQLSSDGSLLGCILNWDRAASEARARTEW